MYHVASSRNKRFSSACLRYYFNQYGIPAYYAKLHKKATWVITRGHKEYEVRIVKYPDQCNDYQVYTIINSKRKLVKIFYTTTETMQYLLTELA